ncbi:L-type lectin-domain containing receptor kinase S.1 [Linum perenne]
MKLLSGKHRRQILADVAERLNYLYYGWNQVVIHLKSNNVLLDSEMRGHVGDFGLANDHNEIPNITRWWGDVGLPGAD